MIYIAPCRALSLHLPRMVPGGFGLIDLSVLVSMAVAYTQVASHNLPTPALVASKAVPQCLAPFAASRAAASLARALGWPVSGCGKRSHGCMLHPEFPAHWTKPQPLLAIPLGEKVRPKTGYALTPSSDQLIFACEMPSRLAPQGQRPRS